MPRDRHDRSQRSPTFPTRFIESDVIELFRTDLLPKVEGHVEIASFVDEFLEDFIKSIIRAIDREPTLIRKLLKDKRVNAADPPEENKDQEERPYDDKGLIPTIFERVKKQVPDKYFIYNSVLDFIRQICI